MAGGGGGPLPKDPTQRRRKITPVALRPLPRGGYAGPLPKWPLPGTIYDHELELWERVWRTPAAAAWVELKIEHEVALYVRYFVRGMGGNIGATQLAQRMADHLGLNPYGMIRLRWQVTEDEVTGRRTGRLINDQPERRTRPRAVEG